jgi:hypothetical protein
MSKGPRLALYSIGGAVYGGVLGALTAISYRIFNPIKITTWAGIGAIVLAIFFSVIEWWGRAGE